MKILSKTDEGLYIEKKSRFICHLKYVSSLEEANEFILSEKKKYYDAKHHCSALILGENCEICRANDDGEPSGTAGKPLLEILMHEGITDVVCVVTRYFGGTLLGTGGLVRAYSESLKDAISKSEFKEKKEAYIYKVVFSYSFDNAVMKCLKDYGIEPVSKEYTDNVFMEFHVPTEISDIRDKMVDITNNSVSFLSEEKSFIFI